MNNRVSKESLRNSEPSAGATAAYSGPVILIGSSTGGVEALEVLLESIPATAPPILITQHMPHSFLESFGKRLNARFPGDISLAKSGELLSPGMVRIAPSEGGHLLISGRGPFRSVIEPGGLVSGHRPSVDELFSSAVPLARRICAALLTGMGRDGASGLAKLRKAGAFTVAQDEATSVVYGMPRAAIELGAARQVLPLPEIGQVLLQHAQRLAALK